MQLSRRARWVVPAAAVAVTGIAVGVSTIPSADAAPALPAKTPAQLLSDVAATHKMPPLTGTVVETTSLGLPQLPQTGNPTSLSSLLTGSHTVKVYWQDAKHFRLAVPQSLSESDVIRNGSTAWLWQSNKNEVTKFTVPADNSNKMPTPTTAPLTPQQAANQVLQQVGKTTAVSVQSNVDVAGEAAYQLVLAPKDARSTIGSVRIAIDGKTGVPLRLQVFAKGGTTPAFQVGYTSISYTAPNPANFTFTPPRGATVTTPGAKNANGTKSPSSDMAGAGTYGSDWLTVAELPSSALLPGSSGTGSAASPAPSSSSSSGSPLGGNSQEIISAILGSAKPVSGAWGSGQLLHTSLLNVLITGGKIYVGAVDPSVLEAAVGHTVPAGSGPASSSAASSAAAG
jgi:outer membrane lipoprotein-sorting protein